MKALTHDRSGLLYLGFWAQPIAHSSCSRLCKMDACLQREFSSLQIPSLFILTQDQAPLWEGRMRKWPRSYVRCLSALAQPPTSSNPCVTDRCDWRCSALQSCLKFGSLTPKDCCKYLVTSHVISPPSCSPPPLCLRKSNRGTGASGEHCISSGSEAWAPGKLCLRIIAGLWIWNLNQNHMLVLTYLQIIAAWRGGPIPAGLLMQWFPVFVGQPKAQWESQHVGCAFSHPTSRSAMGTPPLGSGNPLICRYPINSQGVFK